MASVDPSGALRWKAVPFMSCVHVGRARLTLTASPGTFVHGCSVQTCTGVEGHLTVDWDGSVDCTGFVGL